MDLNPASAGRLDESVRFLQQDCSAPWAVPAGSLDVVFSSNFLEHLPSKAHVDLTLDRARAALRPGGRLILMGPNIRFLAGEYWDFWDHHVPISHESIVEALRIREFEIERVWSRFLPYTMVGRGRTAFSPVLTDAALRIYLACPFLWRAFGRQFLVVARA
jgi:SAM-dependent methyltransferase